MNTLWQIRLQWAAIKRVFIICFFSGSLHAADFYQAYRVSSPIVVDGLLDEADWSAAAPIYLADVVTGEKPALPVMAKILWDNRNLYVAFQVQETNIWAAITERDTPAQAGFKRYTENFIKLYLDPDGDGRNYTEMHISPNGAISDKWQTLPWGQTARRNLGLPLETPAQAHWEWNCTGMTHAVTVQGTLNQPNDVDQGWSVEMAIPFSSLAFVSGKAAFPPADGDIWKVHLGRRFAPAPSTSATEAQYWTWPRVGERDCHRADTWGCLVFYTNSLHKMPAAADLPKGRFDWKMLWVRANVLKTAEDVERMVTQAERMGFNQIAAEPREDIIRAVHARKMGFYAWWINLRVRQLAGFIKAHPECCQQVMPEELALNGKPRINPDRENFNSGNWLCPDRGLVDEEWHGMEAILRTNAVDGLALDYIGYKNYHACYCEESNARRRAYAAQHPELTKEQVEWKFSEESMAAYTRQIRERALALNPNLKLAIHIYPDFDPDPYYAAGMPVDYCGQTVAWFYKPFWSYEREYEITGRCVKDRGKVNAFVPFVGISAGDNAKSPERLRTEIRIAGSAQTGKIMLAFYETFLAQPELVEVVAAELK
ncbi:MAG: carbohydrate-binding family 9-like protein [Kiritimatiellae bacterium]|nr:carbohydrate-binding family 9-like protein [Kiritimatiellia bacterium]